MASIPKKKADLGLGDFDAQIGGVVDASEVVAGPMVVLVYGPSKSGRTWFATTWPRPFFLVPSDEPGMRTIEGMNGIKYAVISSKKDLEAKVDVIERFAQAGKLPYQTIVLDPVDAIVSLVALSFTVGGKTDWQLVMPYLKTFFGRLHKWGCHVVMTALPKAEKDELTQEMITGPMLPGQMISWLQRFCSGVFFMEAVTEKKGNRSVVSRRLYIHGRGPWKAGVWDPKSALEDVDFVDPSYDAIAVPLGYPSLEEAEQD